MNNVYERLAETNVTNPGDKITILHTTNLISNTITCKFENTKTDEASIVMGIANIPRHWRFLRDINNIGGRTVLYQIDNGEPFPFEDSIPYKGRFK